ncbi:DUF779 domain-containing protein [Myxococcota bacterium]|nr:DUF779 domain-containing protein [Myxococcota bacterium]
MSTLPDQGFSQVSVTDEAAALIRRLVLDHGPVMFFQSGGCCDGSAPMCWPKGEFRLGERDVRLGVVEGAEYWIGGDQYERWRHTRLVLDVVRGRGAGFSLEAPEGVRFIIRSELCSVEELAALGEAPLPRGRDQR